VAFTRIDNGGTAAADDAAADADDFPFDEVRVDLNT
jgi:hypothetical protein